MTKYTQTVAIDGPDVVLTLTSSDGKVNARRVYPDMARYAQVVDDNIVVTIPISASIVKR